MSNKLAVVEIYVSLLIVQIYSSHFRVCDSILIMLAYTRRSSHIWILSDSEFNNR